MFEVNVTHEFETWFEGLEENLQDSIAVIVTLLEEHGPHLSRPYADTLSGSRISNLKELRVQHAGNPYRILYAFDPRRQALLLLGGNKAGDNRWYEKMIPLAEQLFQAYLEEIAEDKNDG